MGLFTQTKKMAPTTPKKVKNSTDVVTDEDREPGVIYIGHVPHGFYESQMKKYFSQFGKVLAIKVSRSKKNGKSKGYAFVKFQYAAVAKTVAETCHNYLFFNKLLKCEYKKPEEVNKDTFFNYKWKPNNKPKRLHNSAKTDAKVEQSAQRTTRRQAAKLKKLKEMGVDLELSDIVSSPPVKEPAVVTEMEESAEIKETESETVLETTTQKNTKSVGDETTPTVDTKTKKRKRSIEELEKEEILLSPSEEKVNKPEAKRRK